jgi:spore coat polysaccharide biosynthesis predicted glycosyltransferase SpsG
LTNNASPANSILSDEVNILEGTDALSLDGEYDITVADLPEKSNDPDVECIDLELMQSLADATPTLVVIQELINQTVCCDGVINSHVYADITGYSWIGDEPDWLLGGDYVIFDEDIRRKAEIPSSWNEQPERAVITIGGSDIQNVTPRAMRAFENTAVDVDVIIGPGVSESRRNEIKTTTSVPGTSFHVHENPDNFAELLHRADFAVSALGLTTYELFALKTPIIGIETAPDQAPKATFIRQNDIGLVIENKSTEAIEKGVTMMLNKPNERQRYRNQAADFIDPRGIYYVVDYLERAASAQQ